MKKFTILIVVLCMMFTADFTASCSKQPGNDGESGTDTETEITEEQGEPEENAEAEENEEMVTIIAGILDCPERTAQGIYKTIYKATEENITAVAVIDDPYSTVLELTGESGRKYYAYVETGYFLSRINADSPDGEMLFIAIQ